MNADEVVTFVNKGPKYVVFKADAFNEVAPVITFPNEDAKAILRKAIVDDAVVIRLQDTFAGSALFGYAHSISVAIGILREAGLEEIADGLQTTADYFISEAQRSIDMIQKLPD